MSKHGIAEVVPGHLIVVINDFLPVGRILEDAVNFAYRLLRNKAVHHGETKAFRFDVFDEYCVAVNHHRDLEIDRLE